MEEFPSPPLTPPLMAADDEGVTTFWSSWVRNPLFAVAVLALLAGLLGVTGWGVALAAATVAALMGDAAWHLARKSRMRAASRLAERAAEASKARALERFTDYNRVDQEPAA